MKLSHIYLAVQRIFEFLNRLKKNWEISKLIWEHNGVSGRIYSKLKLPILDPMGHHEAGKLSGDDQKLKISFFLLDISQRFRVSIFTRIFSWRSVNFERLLGKKTRIRSFVFWKNRRLEKTIWLLRLCLTFNIPKHTTIYIFCHSFRRQVWRLKVSLHISNL